jgi:glycosyltransferase involved in cell wall biosynthesis
MEQVFQNASRFDVLHFHTDYLHFPLARRHPVPNITTEHGRLDLPDLWPLFADFPEIPLVSISDSQRLPLPESNWQGTVHHGLPRDLHTFSETPCDYLAFLGRFSPEKRPDRAIEIALRSGLRLKIAARVFGEELPYVERDIEPLLRDHAETVEQVGEVGGAAKNAFLGGARALLFPIDWPEPFGLVMIEALACGTPVIAWRNGSVPEVIEDGVTGFIVDSIDDAVAAVRQVGALSRRECRRSFEQRFTAARMAREYELIYRHLAARWPRGQRSHATVNGRIPEYSSAHARAGVRVGAHHGWGAVRHAPLPADRRHSNGGHAA